MLHNALFNTYIMELAFMRKKMEKLKIAEKCGCVIVEHVEKRCILHTCFADSAALIICIIGKYETR